MNIPAALPTLWQGLIPSDERYAVKVVEVLLAAARKVRASDIHLLPTPGQDASAGVAAPTGGAEANRAASQEAAAARALDVLFRIDGVLHSQGTIPSYGPNVVSRLKVLAGLLTYRSDVPQEGRIRSPAEGIEIRVSTFPTIHGEKAVVRLFVGTDSHERLADLRLPSDILASLERSLTASRGVMIACGPSGSGKTTTLYACLRHLLTVAVHPRSICTLEDPVEALIPGVAQSQINPVAGFDYEIGLKSLMRQDPEVIMVGEIRDPRTAGIVFQASLTGHLVLTTFHAGESVDAVSRLLDMGVEPYVLRSGLLGILTQRLLRRACPSCRQTRETIATVTNSVTTCEACRNTGYQGRQAVAEYLSIELPGLGDAILSRRDSRVMREILKGQGIKSCRDRAQALAATGETSQLEVLRVFGELETG